ncbi:MAG: hypothetical protein RSB44_10815, partial [Carnobacterium sp.]
MSEDLKRVGLIFTAEGAVDFKKTLQTTNVALQENRSQFKLTKSSWDENTKASEKLSETNKYLTKQYDESTKKVSVLTTELKTLEGAENRDEIAIGKKKSALISATATQENYRKGVEETSAKIKLGTADIEAYSNKLNESGNKAISTGKTLSKGLTAPIVALGTAAVVSWNKIDEAYDNIVLKTGATGEALSDLTNNFDNIYGSMPVDSVVVSEALGEVNTRFKLTGDELEELSVYMIKFSEITGKDVTSSVELAQKIQGQWNLSLEDTQNAMGLVAKKSQDTGLSVDVLMSAVTENSATFKEMGLNVAQSVNLLGDFESVGLDSQVMITGLKKASANYNAEGKSMGEGLSDLVGRLQNSSTSAEATAEAYELFGKKTGLSFITASKEGKISLEGLSTNLNDYGKTVTQTYENTLDPMDKSKVAQNNLTLSGKALGDVIQITLGPIMENLSNTIKGVTSWFTNLDGSTKNMIVILGAVIAILPLLIMLLGSTMRGVSSIISVGVKLAPIIAGISGSMLGWIAVISLVIGAIVLMYNNCEWFRNGVNDIFGGITNILKNLIDFVVNVFTGNWGNAWQNVVNIFGSIFNTICDIAKFPLNVVIGLINGMLDAVESGINWCIGSINKISFKVPKWAQGVFGKKVGFDIGKISLGNIPYLASGGDLLNGMAMVAEAGPELLMQQGNQTKVVPLSSSSKNSTEIFDYEKMAMIFVKAMKYLSINLD